MASVVSFQAWPNVVVNREIKPRFGVRVRGLGDDGQTLLSSDTVAVNGSSFPGKKKEANGALVGGEIGEKEKSGALVDVGNGSLKSRNQKTWVKDAVSKDLEVLWDDGYGTKTVKDYLEGAKEIINLDGGPPRWFCPVDCGHPLKDSPILLFLPGMDGVGLGLMLHHKALGKVFEVRCLHIPVYDRTPFDGLVKIVEETVRLEHASNPKKPIYIVSESFGACIALAVAARNPKVDLVVILANPATSFGRSQLQPLLPLLEAWPAELQNAIPYALSFVMGDPMKMAMVDIEYTLPSGIKMEQLSNNLSGLLPYLSVRKPRKHLRVFALFTYSVETKDSHQGLADIIPKETLLWKLKLLKTGAAYANSRLHAVKAEVLVLASGKDNMLPSREEAERLYNSIENCVVRYFKDNGHTIFLEDGVNLLTVIKGTNKYRRSSKLDFVADFVPPSISEFKRGYSELVGLLRFLAGSTMFSTLDDGKIVKGLAGVPNEGPVLFVGYHMLLGLEVYSLVEEFIRQKNVVVRGIAHPEFFSERKESSSTEFSVLDWLPVMGAVPVSASNLFKLLSTNSHVLLYPGGAREALHNRGEEYKLFWPDQPEFVRMAVRFGATIVPFGTVGEDDIAELALDYNDLMKIPIVNDFTRETASKATRVRDESKGEVANQELFLPVVLPKVPGRFYFLFGKPIPTKGKEEVLKDRENVNRLYLEIKSEVESSIAYLLKKREEDPYRNIIDRTVYRALNSPLNETPAFDP